MHFLERADNCPGAGCSRSAVTCTRSSNRRTTEMQSYSRRKGGRFACSARRQPPRQQHRRRKRLLRSSSSTPSRPRHSRACRRIQGSTARSTAHLRAVAIAGATRRGTTRCPRPCVAAPARDIQNLHHASPRLYRSLRDEFAELPTSLAQARSFQNLGDRPLLDVTATRDALAGWLPLQDRLVKLSTNSSHRLVPYTHEALVTDRTAAEASTQAIRDVVHAARSATPLNKS